MEDDLSTLYASLFPSSGDQVALMLASAAVALRVSEAGLAREIGVTRATLSSWKTREALPAKHAEWFRAEFVERVVFRRGQENAAGLMHAGVEGSLQLFRQTDFNPFGLPTDRVASGAAHCARHFEGIVCLTLFVQHMIGVGILVECQGLPDDQLENAVLSRVADTVAQLLVQLRHLVPQ